MRRLRPATAAALVVLLRVVAATSEPLATLGADPTPTPNQPTCADRYPVDGPAGLDLRLGCIANELVGHYTGGGTSEPPRISTYVGPLLGLAGGLAVLFVAFRFVLGRSGRRMAPAAPSEWWLCPDCRSVNGRERPRCYSCGRAWSADVQVVPTVDRPELVQRFGGDRKSASSDRPGRGPDASPR